MIDSPPIFPLILSSQRRGHSMYVLDDPPSAYVRDGKPLIT